MTKIFFWPTLHVIFGTSETIMQIMLTAPTYLNTNNLQMTNKQDKDPYYTCSRIYHILLLLLLLQMI